MPTAVDVYGTGNRLAGGTLKSNNPALTAALDAAYKEWQASAKTKMGTRDEGTYGKLVVTGYGTTEQQALENQFKKARLDPSLIPKNVDLGMYNTLSQYNGVGADPLAVLNQSTKYDDGRTKDEANTRDFIAKGLANSQSNEKIWKNIQGYNSEHQGGWASENLGISGETLAVLAIVAAGLATGGFGLLAAVPGAGGATLGAAATSAATTGTAAAVAGTAAAATGATAATGVAGYLGMNAGYLATAVNVAAVRTVGGVLTGQNIGDAVKAGVVAGALSPVGGMASNAVVGAGGGTILGGLASGAATGGLGAAVRGGDVGKGILGGVVGNAVGQVGSYLKDGTVGTLPGQPAGAVPSMGAAPSADSPSPAGGGEFSSSEVPAMGDGLGGTFGDQAGDSGGWNDNGEWDLGDLDLVGGGEVDGAVGGWNDNGEWDLGDLDLVGGGEVDGAVGGGGSPDNGGGWSIPTGSGGGIKIPGVGGTTSGGGSGGGGSAGGLGGLIPGMDSSQLLGVLGSLYSGKDTADAISKATDKLVKGIETAQGTLLTSKTEALDALSKGLIGQKEALQAGLIDANGAITESTKRAIESVRQGADAGKAALASSLSPYTEAGKAALARMQAGTAKGGEFNTTFTMDDATNSAAMKFAQQQGADIIQNSAIAKGGLLGTNALVGLTKFGQANAAQYQQQAFDQWLANRNANQAGVQSLVNTGLNASTTLGNGLANIETSTGNNIGGLESSAGRSIASNITGTAGAVANAIGTNANNAATVSSNFGRDTSNLQVAGGQALASGIIGSSNAVNTGINNAISAYGALKPATMASANPNGVAAPGSAFPSFPGGSISLPGGSTSLPGGSGDVYGPAPNPDGFAADGYGPADPGDYWSPPTMEDVADIPWFPQDI